MQNFFRPVTLIVAITCCLYLNTFSQVDRSTWQISGNAGYVVYQGDLTPNSVSGYKSISYFFGIGGTKIIDPYISVKLNVSYGKLKADESRYSSFHKDRAFSFSTSITEITPLFSWNILGNNYLELEQDFSPYVFAGAGVALMKVKRDFTKINRTVFNANHWVSQGLAVDSATKIPSTAFVIPIGAGTEYYINDDFSISADLTYRFCFSDYLDGFSKSGNKGRHDSYHTLTIGLVHTLFSGRAGGVTSPRSIF